MSTLCTVYILHLQPAKVEAIECIGYGRAGKVFLEFARPFWAWGQGQMSVFKLAWGEERVREGASADWTRAILGFDQVVDNPRVLVCWLGGEAVAAMEELEEEEVAARLCALLRSCTGDATLPAPVGVRRTAWCTDELFLGSYSYGGMRTDAPRHQEALAAPSHCQGRVLFAGEATDAKWFSTMHGARRSGIREASRVLDRIAAKDGR